MPTRRAQHRNGPNCTPAGSISRVRANRSQIANAIAATSAAHSTGRPQSGSTCLPSGFGLYKPQTTSPSAMASSTPPTTSTRSGGPSRRSREGRLKWIITIAIAASGTLIQNTSPSC